MASDEYFIKLGKSIAGPTKRERIEALWKAGKLLETAEVSPDKIHWETVKEFLGLGGAESEDQLSNNFVDDSSINDAKSTANKDDDIGINDKLPDQIKKILLKNEIVLNFEWLGEKGGCCSQSKCKNYFIITNLRCIIEKNNTNDNDEALASYFSLMSFIISKSNDVKRTHSLPIDKIASFTTCDNTKNIFGCSGFVTTSVTEHFLLIRMLDGSKYSFLFLQPAKIQRIAKVLFNLIKKND